MIQCKHLPHHWARRKSMKIFYNRTKETLTKFRCSSNWFRSDNLSGFIGDLLYEVFVVWLFILNKIRYKVNDKDKIMLTLLYNFVLDQQQ
jgi:hypothetical protein